MDTLRRLKKLVSDNDYPDAVSMEAESLQRIRNEFQQEFELDTVSLKDIEAYINSKILIRVSGGKEEFKLLNFLKERN